MDQTDAQQQQRALAAIELFVKNPQAAQLRLHQLKGELYPQFSISAGGDLRLHFLKSDPETIVFTAIGTHAQLYE